MTGRWDGDDRRRGIGNAEQFVAGATELVAAFGEPGWVAELPEDHLLPHVQAWCERDGRLVLMEAFTDERNAYVLEFEWRGELTGVGQVRAAVFSLIGSFAESATYVRQRRMVSDSDAGAGRLRFEIGTGELAPDTRFQSHGHTVVIDVAGCQTPGGRHAAVGSPGTESAAPDAGRRELKDH